MDKDPEISQDKWPEIPKGEPQQADEVPTRRLDEKTETEDHFYVL